MRLEGSIDPPTPMRRGGSPLDRYLAAMLSAFRTTLNTLPRGWKRVLLIASDLVVLNLICPSATQRPVIVSLKRNDRLATALLETQPPNAYGTQGSIQALGNSGTDPSRLVLPFEGRPG